MKSDKHASVSVTLRFPHPMTVFAIVMGGHLPLQFLAGYVVVIDRNVLSFLERHIEGKPHSTGTHWWLTQLDAEDIAINPIHCATEGLYQRTPTLSEFLAEVERASKIVEQALPRAKIIRLEVESLPQAYQNVLDALDRSQDEAAFLMNVMPHLVHRMPSHCLDAARKIVINEARLKNLATNSLTVIAALSCLYDAKDGGYPSPARRVLKPSQTYDVRNAYNAICDLHVLEMFAAGASLGIGPLALCTADRALVAFWCGLKVHNGHWHDGSFTFSLEFGDRLFPRLADEERAQLADELRSINLAPVSTRRV